MTTMLQRRGARDGEAFAVRSHGGDWMIAWHPPGTAPVGKAHGVNAFCVTADDGVVLISDDGALGMARRPSRGR